MLWYQKKYVFIYETKPSILIYTIVELIFIHFSYNINMSNMTIMLTTIASHIFEEVKNTLFIT